MIKIYNTLSRKKEVFTPINSELVRIYACGPTVYDYAHIGNLRTYLMTDFLQRVLKYNGYNVLYVQNITDVGHLVGDGDNGEDKIEKGSRVSGKSAWEIAKFYEDEFKKDTEKINITRPNIIARATEHIAEQIEMVKKLEDMKFAYKTSDGIYFNTLKSKNYGELAKLNKEGLQEGARVEKNPEKMNDTDFALWKFSPKDKKRQMEWNSPWGIGFPGWHIECSAMSTKYLGEPFDIHTGGVDLIPIHHTNEIAQNEAVFGHKTVNYWVHGAFILINGGRMGKSLGNAYNVKDIEKRKIDPLSFRYFTMNANYRQPLNFTWQALESSEKAYKNLIEKISENPNLNEPIDTKEINTEFNKRFMDAINNDLNIPEAVAIMWELIKNNSIKPKEKINTVARFDDVFGLSIIEKAREFNKKSLEIPENVKTLSEERELARKNKDWKKSDEIRKKIRELGYEIKDTETGARFIKT